MSEPIKINASARQPLDVEYLGETYRLTGRIPGEVLTARAAVPRKGLTQAERQQEIGVVTIDAFYDHVLPEDFRQVLDLRDVDQVFQAWSEHVDLGGSNASAS